MLGLEMICLSCFDGNSLYLEAVLGCLAWYLDTFLTAGARFLILGLVGFGSLVWFGFGVGHDYFGKTGFVGKLGFVEFVLSRCGFWWVCGLW